MKKKILILLSLIIITNTCESFALPTKLPQNNTQITKEEAFHTETQNNFFKLFGAIIKIFKGENTSNTIKSSDIKNISSNIKTYQNIESENNPDYEYSSAKEKTDFGLGILEIIAGILSFFGL